MTEALVPEIARVMKRARLGRPVVSEKLSLVHTVVDGVPVTFCTDRTRDPIQRHHRKGGFYEAQELAGLGRIFPEGGVFVDIGANVGNHTLYAALFLKAAQVIPIEPNPVAYRLLVQNVLVNRLSDVVDLSRLGVGVSDKRAGGYAMEPRRTNLGAAKMLDGAGEIEVWPAAELLDGVAPDLVKIDVEGMEMLVLSGLEPVLAAHRPVVLVEVQLENEAAFLDWVAAQGYGVVATHQRYKENRNQLIAEAGRVEALKAAWGPGEDPAQTAPEKDMETTS